MARVIYLPPPSTTPSSPSPSYSPSRSPKRGLIYFIPGNPGYVEYYRDFLLSLRSVVDSSATQYHDRSVPSLHIYGRDLAGFQDDDHHPFSSTNPPVDVQGQVDAARRTLDRLCAKGCDGDDDDDGRGFDFVILVGHSVGAYLALSLVHQYASSLAIRHAILLFPTICHIALSPRGRIATPLLNTIPPSLAARAARVAMWPWPRSVLRWTLGRALGMEPRAAAVTERFLKSRDGVPTGTTRNTIHCRRCDLINVGVIHVEVSST
jgi:pimeloyl-ACP methyl ester carboxylesterase